MKHSTSLLLLFAIILLLPSCVIGRRTINPVVPSSSHAATKGTVAIASIQDLRVFENRPSNPSTPSVDGDHNAMSATAKNRMIGRQRNAYGAAMGDISLPSDQNIQSKTRDLLVEAFAKRGYEVSSGSSNRGSADVRKFWAWFTPGMWYIQFEAVIECRITVSKGGVARSFIVKGYGSNPGQVASDANWNLAYERAFADFLIHLDAELQKAGF